MSGHSKWSDIKRRKGLTDRRHLTRQASRGMIARGERPLYRPCLEPDGGFILIRITELDIVTEAHQRHEVVAVARDLIALWLDVPADSFDIEVGEAQLT